MACNGETIILDKFGDDYVFYASIAERYYPDKGIEIGIGEEGWSLITENRYIGVPATANLATGDDDSYLRFTLPDNLVLGADGNDWDLRVIEAQGARAASAQIAGTAATYDLIPGSAAGLRVTFNGTHDSTVGADGNDWTIQTIVNTTSTTIGVSISTISETVTVGIGTSGTTFGDLYDAFDAISTDNVSFALEYIGGATETALLSAVQGAGGSVDLGSGRSIDFYFDGTRADTVGALGNDWTYNISTTTGATSFVSSTTSTQTALISVGIGGTASVLFDAINAYSTASIEYTAVYAGGEDGTNSLAGVNNSSNNAFTGGSAGAVASVADASFTGGVDGGYVDTGASAEWFVPGESYGVRFTFDNGPDNTLASSIGENGNDWTYTTLASGVGTSGLTISTSSRNLQVTIGGRPQDTLSAVYDIFDNFDTSPQNIVGASLSVAYIGGADGTETTQSALTNTSNPAAFSGGITGGPATEADPLTIEVDNAAERIELNVLVTHTLANVIDVIETLLPPSPNYDTLNGESDRLNGDDIELVGDGSTVLLASYFASNVGSTTNINFTGGEAGDGISAVQDDDDDVKTVTITYNSEHDTLEQHLPGD